MHNLEHDKNETVGELTKKLATKLTDLGLRLTTAESCTGGNLAVALCAEENTAEFYDVGMVVFSSRVSPPSVNKRSPKWQRKFATLRGPISVSRSADMRARKAGMTVRQPEPSASPGI